MYNIGDYVYIKSDFFKYSNESRVGSYTIVDKMYVEETTRCIYKVEAKTILDNPANYPANVKYKYWFNEDEIEVDKKYYRDIKIDMLV